MSKKNCQSHQILNPKTKRCVKKSGKIGKSILKKKTTPKKQINKQKTTPKKQINKQKQNPHKKTTPKSPKRIIKKSPKRIIHTFLPKSLKSKLSKLKLKEYKVRGDGNCQFHALVYVINQNNLGKVDYITLRKEVVNYLRRNENKFKYFILSDNSKIRTTENYNNYIENMSKNKVYGDNITLQVISLLYNLKVIVLRDNRKNNIINETGENTVYVVYRGDDGGDAHYDATTK